VPPGPPIGYGPGNNNTQVTWSNVTVKISHRKNAISELHGDTNPLLLYRVVRWGPYISLFVDHVCTLRNVFNFYRKLKGAVTTVVSSVNPLQNRGNYSATSSRHTNLMGGLLHLVQRGGDYPGPQPAKAPPRCTKCNSPPINGRCTKHRCSAVLMCPVKGLNIL